MHFILLCSAKCFSSLVFSEVCCCQKRPWCEGGRWWLSMSGRARHRYVIEYVSLLANTISHIATRRCYTVFSPCSAIRQRVYCKSDKRWGVSTRCGQTTVVHHQCIHSTLMHNALVHCYQESTLRSTLENVALLEGSVTCCVAKMHCSECSKAAGKE